MKPDIDKILELEAKASKTGWGHTTQPDEIMVNSCGPFRLFQDFTSREEAQLAAEIDARLIQKMKEVFRPICEELKAAREMLDWNKCVIKAYSENQEKICTELKSVMEVVEAARDYLNEINEPISNANFTRLVTLVEEWDGGNE